MSSHQNADSPDVIAHLSKRIGTLENLLLILIEKIDDFGDKLGLPEKVNLSVASTQTESRIGKVGNSTSEISVASIDTRLYSEVVNCEVKKSNANEKNAGDSKEGIFEQNERDSRVRRETETDGKQRQLAYRSKHQQKYVPGLNNKRNDVTIRKDMEKNDVTVRYDLTKKEMTSSQTNLPRLPQAQEETKQSLPTAWIIHDKITSKVDVDRLGRSYAFNGTDLQANKIENIIPTIEKAKLDLDREPDVLIIHCGLSDLLETDTTEASIKSLSIIENVQKSVPHSKILISELLPTLDRGLNVKIRLFNAQIAAAVESMENIRVLQHITFEATRITMANKLYLNRRGSSVLAGSLGRGIRNSLWIHPAQKRDQRRTFYRKRNSYQDRNHSGFYPGGSQPYASQERKMPTSWGSRFRVLYSDYN